MISREYSLIPSIKTESTRSLVLLTFFVSLWICFSGTAYAQEAAQSGYSLIGTIQGGDLTGAVIAVAKGEQSFFRKFDKLPDGSQLVAIRSNSISLKGESGNIYDIYINHDLRTAGTGAAARPSARVDYSPPHPATSNPVPGVNYSPPHPATSNTIPGADSSLPHPATSNTIPGADYSPPHHATSNTIPGQPNPRRGRRLVSRPSDEED